MSACGSTYGKRWPDAPSDQWDTATCIQEHDATPPPAGTIHDSGDGWRWVELDGFVEGRGADGYTDIARDIIQRVIDNTDQNLGTQKSADALTDELCAALGLPMSERDLDQLVAKIDGLEKP